MSKKSVVTIEKIESALGVCDEALFDVIEPLRRPSGMVDEDGDELVARLTEAQQTAACLARDAADLTVRLGAALRQAKVQERIKKVEAAKAAR